MKKWLSSWASIILASVGIVYTIANDLSALFKGGRIMLDQILFRIFIILSICYGIFLVCRFLYNLNRRLVVLEKEPAKRVAATEQLSKKINELAQVVYRVIKKREEIKQVTETTP